MAHIFFERLEKRQSTQSLIPSLGAYSAVRGVYMVGYEESTPPSFISYMYGVNMPTMETPSSRNIFINEKGGLFGYSPWSGSSWGHSGYGLFGGYGGYGGYGNWSFPFGGFFGGFFGGIFGGIFGGTSPWSGGNNDPWYPRLLYGISPTPQPLYGVSITPSPPTTGWVSLYSLQLPTTNYGTLY
ncbi:MAG: hypothetical protein ACMUIS_05545 [bacterium]